METQDIIIADLRDLRVEMRESFRVALARVDQALERCSTECPDNFASKDEVSSIRGWVRANCLATVILIAAFIITHGHVATDAFERVFNWF